MRRLSCNEAAAMSVGHIWVVVVERCSCVPRREMSESLALQNTKGTLLTSSGILLTHISTCTASVLMRENF